MTGWGDLQHPESAQITGRKGVVAGLGEEIGKIPEESRVLTGGNPDNDRQNMGPEGDQVGGCPVALAHQVTCPPCLQALAGCHGGELCSSSYALMWSKDAV